MKNTRETFYRLTIKDTTNNIIEDEPLAFHTESAALDRAYKIMEEHGGIDGIVNADGRFVLWNNEDSTVIEVNPILI